jgi:hypothetical protein
MAKLIAYVGRDEVLVTTKKHEKRMLKEYFSSENCSALRSLNDYDREKWASTATVCIGARVSFERAVKG